MLLPASAELRDKLEHAANLMSHANPCRDRAVIIERAIDLLIDELESAVLAKKKTSRVARPRRCKDPEAVPRADRRTVFERDGIQLSAPTSGLTVGAARRERFCRSITSTSGLAAGAA